MQQQVLDIEPPALLIAVASSFGDDERIAGADLENVIFEMMPAAAGNDDVDLDEGMGVHADGVGLMMNDPYRAGARREDLIDAPVVLADLRR